MNTKQLKKEAQAIADKDQINMVVYRDQYAEYETDVYGYMPEIGLKHCKHYEVIKLLKPGE